MENYIRVMRNVEDPAVFSKQEQQVYVKNVEKSAKPVDVEEAMGVMGEVLSCKLAYSSSGSPLGYAYLQYETKESADNALTKGSVTIKGQEATISAISRMVKTDGGNNLYMKNLPSGLQTEELQTLIKDKLSQQHSGVISSVFAHHNSTFDMPFAFVCYQEKQAAQEVLSKCNGQELFQVGQKVYIAQGMTKQQRKKLLEIKEKNVVRQNLFLKNLTGDISNEQVKVAFSVFGEVTSVAIQCPPKSSDMNPKFKDINTQFGYVCFANGESAEKALSEYSSQPELVAMFHNSQPFIAFHLPKDKFSQQKKKLASRNGDTHNIMQMMQHQMKMFQNPQMFQMMMQMMMPMMNMQQQFMKNGNMPNRMPNMQMPKFNKPMMGLNNMVQPEQVNTQLQQQQPAQPLTTYSSPQQLKENINTFLNLDREKQRSILGELLYPIVMKIVEDNGDAPKITGMLIDFEVFEVSEILEFLENESLLTERITEAKELIEQTN